jgi:hypothetical protein
VDINGNPIAVNDFQGVELNFFITKISHQDPNEEILTKMILGTEPDLFKYKTPLTFPIFGQGRSLYALVGSGIKSKTIEKACQSLVEWCSCEIKALHQGIDLLFQADWSRRAGGSWVKDTELPPLTGLSNFIPQHTSSDTLLKIKNKIGMKDTYLIENNDSNGTVIVKSDTVIKKKKINKNKDFGSMSQNIGALFFILLVAVIVASFIIKRKIN